MEEIKNSDFIVPADFGIPEGVKEIGKCIYLKEDGSFVVTGYVEQDDENHNCDEMGCGWEHVIFRGTVSEFCKKYNLQYCDICDDLKCGDNQNKNE